ncbi:hypothetical protein PSPO01_06033 [Paraphaeosphaeria sporulosa]
MSTFSFDLFGSHHLFFFGFQSVLAAMALFYLRWNSSCRDCSYVLSDPPTPLD